MEVAIERIAGVDADGKVKAGTTVRLAAKCDVSGAAFEWRKDDTVVSNVSVLEIEGAKEEKLGTFTVVAKKDGTENKREITLALADPASAPVAPPDVPAVAEFHGGFAFWSAVVILLIALGVALRAIITGWDIGKADLVAEKTGATALASALAMPLTVVGVLIVAAGAWMAIVEWRGTFKSPPSERGLDVGKVIEAVGKLKGAALLLVVGTILLLSSAWIAQSSAGAANSTLTGPTGPSGPTGPAGP